MAVPPRRLLLLAEGATWFLGVVGLVVWGTYYLWAHAAARLDVERFVTHQDVAPRAGTPDQSLWSPERIVAWRKAAGEPAATPLAVLRIPRLQLEVPVLPGTDDRTLDRAVGHIDDTALPGADGNSGIAGHRDGFFRGLKDIAQGDLIELETATAKELYRVERTWIVKERIPITFVKSVFTCAVSKSSPVRESSACAGAQARPAASRVTIPKRAISRLCPR